MLIQRIYHVDPLLCPKCGGTMKIIAFIEARQDNVIRKILEHCGLWRDPPPRAPPSPAWERPACSDAPDSAYIVELDPEYIEHLHAKNRASCLGNHNPVNERFIVAFADARIRGTLSLHCPRAVPGSLKCREIGDSPSRASGPPA